MENELIILQKYNHPHLMKATEVHRDELSVTIVLPYMDAKSLE